MTTETLTLTDFLLARIAEDEEGAKFHRNDAWFIEDKSTWGDTQNPELVGGGKLLARFDQEHGALAIHHVVRWNPARVLAACEAKRRIVELAMPVAIAGPPEWTPESSADERGRMEAVEQILLDLAAVYADHPDYRDEWRA